MHNGQTVDSMNEKAKELSALVKRSKKSKTDADQIAARRCEWEAGLYVTEDGAPCLPGEVVEACLTEGARRCRLGKSAKGGIIVADDTPLEYSGPKTIKELWEHGGFIKIAAVRVGTARLIRTRPIFPVWSA